MGYEFTNNWFGGVKPIWDALMPSFKPKRILEVGSYEGASTVYLVDNLAAHSDIELHCIDTWEGGIEHQNPDSPALAMNSVEARFKSNMDQAMAKASHKVELVLYKEYSDSAMARLLGSGKRNYFDFVYIDGSHQAPDVLCDAVLGFKLLRIGGIMAFDDFLWSEHLPGGTDPLRCPKPAIDAFVNLNVRKLGFINAPINQFYIQKKSD